MSLFAHYDSEKDRIVGAKPGTLVYLHEEGHRVQNRTGFIAYVRMFQFTAILFILAIITSVTQDWRLITAMTFVLMWEIILETHAWLYAFKKWRQRHRLPTPQE